MAWDDWVDERTTNPATIDVRCGSGGSKRMFTATGQLPTLNPDPDKKLDTASTQIEARFEERGYLPDLTVPDQSDVIDSRTIGMVKKEPRLRFSVTMTLPSETRIAVEISGETECQ